ncbi:protein of unknown function DUF2283 [Pyrolobus fumarii 1A]|uniref:DUF2283 domain-containing protein n=1 Tax=Pyrolobus fumarii (strain DSM 11204 / 1A) TaxID=694429 RepID=G0EG60_PYRF1|nr:DUF2283 domain-containing protein [Pyrolobus fumarii]AEM38308.1 protein of unknown function DUF2283 [Pyrolobus fumarii 1A]
MGAAEIREPRIRYDPDHDILYILVEEGPVDDTIEIADDIFAEVRDGRIVGIEVWKAERIIEAIAERPSEKITGIIGEKRQQTRLC